MILQFESVRRVDPYRIYGFRDETGRDGCVVMKKDPDGDFM